MTTGAKRRLRWTLELYERFVEAVEDSDPKFLSRGQNLKRWRCEEEEAREERERVNKKEEKLRVERPTAFVGYFQSLNI